MSFDFTDVQPKAYICNMVTMNTKCPVHKICPIASKVSLSLWFVTLFHWYAFLVRINWQCGDHDWYRWCKVCPHIMLMCPLTPLTCNPERTFAMLWPRLPSVRCARPQSPPKFLWIKFTTEPGWFDSYHYALFLSHLALFCHRSRTSTSTTSILHCNSTPLKCIFREDQLEMQWPRLVSEAQGLSYIHVSLDFTDMQPKAYICNMMTMITKCPVHNLFNRPRFLYSYGLQLH